MAYRLIIESEIPIFEQALYTAFVPLPASWIMSNYHVDHMEKRLTPGVDHYDQRYFGFMHRNRIVSGCGVNINLRQSLQIEKMGFQLKMPTRANFSEILFFFIKRNEINPLRIGLSLKKLAYELTEKKMKTVYATCTPSVYNFYHLFGWEKIEKKKLCAKKTLYLIRFEAK